MKYVDTHFHLDLWNDPLALVDEIERSEIYTIAVTNTPSVFDYTDALSKGKKYIRAALGLHPELVYQRAGELPLLMEFISRTRYIGEIGLDFSDRNISSKETQIRVFEKIIESCAIDGKKIITVHSRKAERKVIEMIGPKFPGTVILHWYSGGLEALETALDYGFYFSVNYRMTTSKNGQNIIKKIPTERILTESDGPFIEAEGMKSSPKIIEKTCLKLDSLMKAEKGMAKKNVYENFARILSGELS